jgi:hypothetical protein
MLPALFAFAPTGARETRFANQWGGSRKCAVASLGAHTASKNPLLVRRYKHILLVLLLGEKNYDVERLPPNISPAAK